MAHENKTTEQLEHDIERLKVELPEILEIQRELPGRIEVRKERFRKKRVAYENAKGWYEDEVEYLDGVNGRVKQVEGLIDSMTNEVQERKGG